MPHQALPGDLMLKLGKETNFYRILQSQAEVSLRAAEAFEVMVNDLARYEEHTKKIALIEKEGDELTHELQNRIASTFITPIDKEDLRDLSQALDDITDFIEAAAARAALYRLSEPRPDLAPFAVLLVRATRAVCEITLDFTTSGHRSATIRDRLQAIHQIENESDVVFRKALALLFDEPPSDVLLVIKWKEIYDRIETAIDKCEDVAKILGTVIVKYA